MPPLHPTRPACARQMTRRDGLRLSLLLLNLGLVACASPLPPIRWVRLPVDPPGLAGPQAGIALANPAPPAAAGAPAEVWQLMAPLSLPGHLDRDALMLPQGSAGLQPLGSTRWAEPLRDAVPRLLRSDLSRVLGATVWAAPLPPGVRISRQLRVELLALDVTPDARGVALQARWSVADPAGTRLPRVVQQAFVVRADGPDADALAGAHRLALYQLAQAIAANSTLPGP